MRQLYLGARPRSYFLLLWRRRESFGKVQACREISSDVKMSPWNRKDRMQDYKRRLFSACSMKAGAILLLFLYLFFNEWQKFEALT